MNAAPDQPFGPNVIRDMARRLRNGALLPEHQRYLADAFEAYANEIEAGRPASLDKAFGLKQRGGISPPRAAALQRRDDLLRRLWHKSDEWSDLAPAAAARMMSQSAKRYEAIRWPREQKSIVAPLTEPAATWWKILRSDLSVPEAKRLQQILESEIQYGV